MSALPLKAGMCGANRYVCFGPKADMVIFPASDPASPLHAFFSPQTSNDTFSIDPVGNAHTFCISSSLQKIVWYQSCLGR
jgi:hypothetical protein